MVEVHILYGEDFVKFFEEHGIIPEEYITTEQFDTESEARAFLRGVNQSRDQSSYIIITDYNKDVLQEFVGMKGYFNVHTGLTYQITDIDGEAMPDMEQESVHLNDIEIPDWWLSLTDEDYKLICKYHPPLAQYTKGDMYNFCDHANNILIEDISDKTAAVPDNAAVLWLQSGTIEPYQDNEDFIHNVIEEPDTILFIQRG